MTCRFLLIDVDKTLCKETCWTEEECLNATPIKDMVDAVNRNYTKDYIVIYTARIDSLIPATLKWLRKHGILFHAISNNKIPGEYIDDRAILIKDFINDNFT